MASESGLTGVESRQPLTDSESLLESKSLPESQQPECQSLSENLGAVYRQGLWTDVAFRCKDQDADDGADRVRAHRVVLAARSPVFAAMFFGSLADDRPEVDIDDVTSETLKLFMEYIYTDDVKLTEEVVSDVMYAANKYQVESLLKLCSDFLTRVITEDNASTITELAIFYRLPKLQTAATDFIDDNAEQVLKSEGFQSLSLEALEYIIRGNTLHVGEADVIRAVVKWAGKQCHKKRLEASGQNIRSELGQAFFYLRFPTLSSNEIVDFIFKNSDFGAEELGVIIPQAIQKQIVEPAPCYSAMPRRPRQNVCWGSVIETTELSQATEFFVNTTLEISCSETVILDGIFVSHRLLPQGLCNNKNCPCTFTCKFDVEIKELGTSFTFSGSFSGHATTSTHVAVPNSILLPKKEAAYTLTVTISCDDMNSIRYPKVSNSSPVASSYSSRGRALTCTSKLSQTDNTFSVSRCSFQYSDNCRIITGVKYSFPSGR